jgi:putative addiction module component (TIGR02574 family)
MNAEFAPLFELSCAERLQLVEDLWDSIPASDLMLTPEQCQELDRRLLHMESHPDDEVTWEELKARLLKR